MPCASPQAKGVEHDGNHYVVQLVLQGHAFTKPKHESSGSETIGLDIGPRTLAIVPCEGSADPVTFCEELTPNAKKKRRLQRRANNPEHYDEKGRVKNTTRSGYAERKSAVQSHPQAISTAERKLAARRKSLHGNLAHTLVKIGKRIQIEKTSFKGWQKQYGCRIGLRAPGMFVAHLARLVANTGGTLVEVSTCSTRNLLKTWWVSRTFDESGMCHPSELLLGACSTSFRNVWKLARPYACRFSNFKSSGLS
jgi:hypothetical protein